MRAIWRREKPLEFKGQHYQIPYAGPTPPASGKPLKSILHGRADIPIYLAAIGPKNVALAAEIADGWLPVFFSPERAGVFKALARGGLRAGGRRKSLARSTSRPPCRWWSATTCEACRAMVKPRLALYVGGMGARGKNFYNDLVSPLRLRGGGRERPGSLPRWPKAGGGGRGARRARGRGRALRPEERIRERLAAWREAGVTTLSVRRPARGDPPDGRAGSLTARPVTSAAG